MSENDIQYYIPANSLPATVVAIRTSKGKSQSEGDELIQYEYTEQIEGFIDEGKTSTHVRRSEIRAGKDGVVKKIHVTKGEVIENADKVLIEYEGCDHDTQYEGLCVVCYKSVPKNAKSHVNMTHDAVSLSVSRNEAKRLEQNTVNRLLQEGKLSLIVDLDQTLIHATVGTVIEEWVNSLEEIPKDIRKFHLPDSPKPYYIKLRPHLTTFLQKVSDLYELHIYTMGTRNYAAAVASVIDPDGKLFSQRILSRDENADMTSKSIERLFPCDTSMVVVIDDRADVWRYSPNLVKVFPYEYFIGTGDINAGHLPKLEAQAKTAPIKLPDSFDDTTSKPLSTSEDTAPKSENTSEEPASTVSTESQPEAKSSKEPEATTKNSQENKSPKPASPVKDDNDSELERVLDLLETIHEQYYDALENYKQKTSTKKADVKGIIHGLKSEVLKGVHILFSGVIPKHQAPERTDIWRQADSFGAHCYHDLDPRITHVVAAQPGTEKVMRARRRKNIKIVRPEWLYNSVTKWEKQDEKPYLLQSAPGKELPNSTTPPILTEGEETGMEEDDQGGISEGMDENHRPLSMNNEEINEHLKSVNWDDMEKEVEDLVGDIDESDFDSDTSATNTQSDVSIDGNRSPLVNLKRARIPRKSGLGATVTYGSSDDEDDNDSIGNGLGMSEIGNENDTMNSDGSDGDIDDESGSNSEGDESQGGSEVASDAESSKRPTKRRRVGGAKNKKAARAGRDSAEEDNEADDETTMDYSTMNVGSQGDKDSDVDEDEDDEAFVNFMESDIGAQLIEDQDEEE